MQIKPLSVNECWQGRRFKTEKYLAYEKEVFYRLKGLPQITVPVCKLSLMIVAGLSSKNADIDNIAKPFIDILQKYYQFNDKQIYALALYKEDVKKGDEYIEFKIVPYVDPRRT